jgi:hypothetical protein
MAVSYQEVRNHRQWKATTGLCEAEFLSLSMAIEKAYEMLHEVSLGKGAENLRKDVVLSHYKEALYFVLFQLKNDLTNDTLGVVFGMDGSAAWRNVEKYLKVLEVALRLEGALPKRRFQTVEEFKTYLKADKDLKVDVTEFRIQRPSEGERQKESYSGKKSHTAKSLLVSARKKRIAYLSSLHPGSHHDFTILQDCFSMEQEWFKSFVVWLDLGFQGFADKYRCRRLFIPVKKKRVAKGECNDLSDEQKQSNKAQARQRVAVAHSIGGMKRFRILSNRLRLKSTTLTDTIIGVCAGLYNFTLNNT